MRHSTVFYDASGSPLFEAGGSPGAVWMDVQPISEGVEDADIRGQVAATPATRRIGTDFEALFDGARAKVVRVVADGALVRMDLARRQG